MNTTTLTIVPTLCSTSHKLKIIQDLFYSLLEPFIDAFLEKYLKHHLDLGLRRRMYLLFIVFTGNIIFKLFVLEHNECDNFEKKIRYHNNDVDI